MTTNQNSPQKMTKKSEYNAFSADFARTRQNAWPEFDLLRPYLQKNTTFLDVGCGNGRLRKFFPEGIYTGMDLSGKLLDIAKKKNPNDAFLEQSFTKKWLISDNSMDVVVGMASFHHALTKKDQQFFMKEAMRVLKPNGILFLTTWILPRKYFWPNFCRLRFKVWNVPFGKEKHPRLYRNVSQKELKNRFLEQNFQLLSLKNSRGRNLVAIGQKRWK